MLSDDKDLADLVQLVSDHGKEVELSQKVRLLTTLAMFIDTNPQSLKVLEMFAYCEIRSFYAFSNYKHFISFSNCCQTLVLYVYDFNAKWPTLFRLSKHKILILVYGQFSWNDTSGNRNSKWRFKTWEWCTVNARGNMIQLFFKIHFNNRHQVLETKMILVIYFNHLIFVHHLNSCWWTKFVGYDETHSVDELIGELVFTTGQWISKH